MQSGDVIAIDKGSGKISKVVRSFSWSRDIDCIDSNLVLRLLRFDVIYVALNTHAHKYKLVQMFLILRSC